MFTFPIESFFRFSILICSSKSSSGSTSWQDTSENYILGRRPDRPLSLLDLTWGSSPTHPQYEIWNKQGNLRFFSPLDNLHRFLLLLLLAPSLALLPLLVLHDHRSDTLLALFALVKRPDGRFKFHPIYFDQGTLVFELLFSLLLTPSQHTWGSGPERFNNDQWWIISQMVHTLGKSAPKPEKSRKTSPAFRESKNMSRNLSWISSSNWNDYYVISAQIWRNQNLDCIFSPCPDMLKPASSGSLTQTPARTHCPE